VQQALLGEKSTLVPVSFKDIPKDHALWPAVQLAIAYGWMTGFDKENFGPGKQVKRRSAALILSRRAGLTKPFNAYRPAPAGQPAFADVPLYDRQAAEIEALQKAGAVAPCSTDPLKFCPDQPITANEFIAMMSKALKRPIPLREDGKRPMTRGEVAELLYTIALGENR
jgi:hypothetical protein